MPTAIDAKTHAGVCARCNFAGETFLVRAERLCSACFHKYVATKVVKRLEANKIRAPYNKTSTRLLLPVSFGTSSIVLLNVLNEHNKKRAQQGRHEAYSLHLVHVDLSLVMDVEDHHARVETLEEILPACPLTTLPIQSCFEFGIELDELLEVSSTTVLERPTDNAQRLLHILNKAKNHSYRADMLNIILRRLLDAYARREHFDFVLYGDTSTRLAERTLAEVAKGRGQVVPSLNGDLQSGTAVPGVFLMRDVLRKEVQAYAEMVNSPLMLLSTGVNAPQSCASVKDHTIDDLMQEYISSVEQNFPSIVANVVRTTARLKAPEACDSKILCRSCNTPINRPSGAGDTVSVDVASSNLAFEDISSLGVCYACQKMLNLGSITSG